jgi:hypothetical protein
MKKLFLAIILFLFVGQAHATLLDKFPLTLKQTLVVGTLVGAGAALRYCYFYQKYLDNRDIVSRHIEEKHITNNTDLTLLDNSSQQNPCDKNICTTTDENAPETREFFCIHSHFPHETLTSHYTGTYCGIPTVYAVTYNKTKSISRATAKPVIFDYPILRYLTYLLYPVAYFSEKKSCQIT